MCIRFKFYFAFREFELSYRFFSRECEREFVVSKMFSEDKLNCFYWIGGALALFVVFFTVIFLCIYDSL